VLDSTRREVARDTHPLVPSVCDPTELQAAQFSARVPPGRYLVGLTVKSPGGKRGLFRDEVRLEPPPARLALSDVVVVCGTPDLAVTAGGVRIEPRPAPRVRGAEPLIAYFEIYRLSADREGRSRFQYEYTVRSAEKERTWLQKIFTPRPVPPPISATREEENAGSLRRQFVSVPVSSLPPGRYRLEIRVRDLDTGEEVEGEARFTRGAEGN